jgi:hypothetical protein
MTYLFFNCNHEAALKKCTHEVDDFFFKGLFVLREIHGRELEKREKEERIPNSLDWYEEILKREKKK